MIDMSTFLISGFLGVVGGMAGAALVRAIRKPTPPPWAVEKTDAIATGSELQDKIGQAYQVLGHWAYHFQNGTKPTEEEMEMDLDYFGISENFDPQFLRYKAPK